ncbi:MAG: histidine kinase [Candidatus Midichloriaceae bacterium]|jgi:DNA-binding CsgD family transcriptional regulator/predicted ester cyclase|nr:histidine kinase [Candidatus Midichloriaceae bacterium]
MIYKKVVEEFIDELWNKRQEDVHKVHQLIGEKVIITSPLKKTIGSASLESINNKWLMGFPNLKVRNVKLISEGSKVVAIWDGSGNQLGDFNGVEGTGKEVSYRGMTFFEFFDNKVVNYECVINMLDVYEQLGFFLNKEKYKNQGIIKINYITLLEEMKKIYSMLSIREIECLSCLVNGKTAKETARILDISHRTVEKYIGASMLKLSMRNKNEIIDGVYQNGTIFMLRDLYDLIIIGKKIKT